MAYLSQIKLGSTSYDLKASLLKPSNSNTSTAGSSWKGDITSGVVVWGQRFSNPTDMGNNDAGNISLWLAPSGTTASTLNMSIDGTYYANGSKQVLHEGNYTNYTVKKDGTGASGTWPISITGNAATATKLATARTIQTNLASTSAVSFNGTANITPGVTGVLGISNGGTGANNRKTAITNLGVFGLYNREDIGISPNFDNPGVNGLFEMRAKAETTGETGSKPFDGYAPFISLRYSNTMFQLAGTNGSGFFIRGKQAWDPTLTDMTWQKILTSDNYTDYTVTKDGVGASGTWGISITGNAATATNADKLDGYHEYSFLRYRDTVSGSGGTSHSNSLWSQIGIRQYNDALPDGMADNATYTWGAVVSLPGNDSRLDIWYNHQTSSNGNGLRYRTGWNSDKRSWATILDSSNYTSYTVTKTGGGASGTWPISISGNAATATTAVKLARDGNTVYPMTFYWNGQGGQPSWLWGGNDGTNMYVYNPSNFSVNYANSCGTSSSSNWLNTNSTLQYGASGLNYFNISGSADGAANANGTPTADWYHIIRMNHANGSGYYFDIASCFHNNNMYFKRVASGASSGWQHIWVQGNAVTSAVWNDYAECRESDCEEFGYVLMEVGDDSLTKTTERLSHFAGVSSDTWGFSQGETDKAKTPIAVAGRVLVYPYQDRNNYKSGDCVCAAPGGTVDIMTREEVREWPDRIVGTVSCVPNYEEWGGGEGADRDPVKVNGRIWIKVK